MKGAHLFFLIVLGFAAFGGEDLAAGDMPLAVQSDTTWGEHRTDSTSAMSTISSVAQVKLKSLDSVIRRVDPLVLFPNLASMGTVTMPKGYAFLLIGFVAAGGLMIIVADAVRTRKRKMRARRKRLNQNRGASAFKMQLAFEAFVVTLFDPMYFRHQKKKQTVLAGARAEGEVPADLEFEFDFRDMKAKFAVKCLYFTSVSKGDVQLFYSGRNERLKFLDSEIPVYFILGFGGKPDDPKELFLLPAEVAKRGVVRKEALAPYSKSGMFFYNVTTGRLQ